MSPTLHKMKQAQKKLSNLSKEKSQQVAEPRNLNLEANLFRMSVLSHSSMDSQCTPLIWAQSILSFTILPKHHSTRRTTCSALACAILHLEHLSQVLLSCQMHAFSPLWRLCWVEGMVSSQSALTVLTTCIGACKHWLRAHFSLRTRTKNYSAKPKVPCLLKNNMKCKPMNHKAGPFCWDNTTFSTDNVTWECLPRSTQP